VVTEATIPSLEGTVASGVPPKVAANADMMSVMGVYVLPV
jgi:hypothetical protein